ncbi:MAG TPA: zf-HC2 domain-containing protein [Ilumatobacteraceae bacterium]
MDNCQDAIRELEAFLDGSLSEDGHTAIHAHLAGCDDCLQAFDFQAELRQVIAAKCRNDEMPAGLLSRIEQCFNEDFDGDGRIG